MAKTKGRGARGGGGRPAAVEVKIDRRLEQAWKAALAELEGSNRAGMLSWDRKYEAIGAIVQHDPPLYLAGGVSTVADFVKKYLPGEDVRCAVAQLSEAPPPRSGDYVNSAPAGTGRL